MTLNVDRAAQIYKLSEAEIHEQDLETWQYKMRYQEVICRISRIFQGAAGRPGIISGKAARIIK
jgi:hypothetical protein